MTITAVGTQEGGATVDASSTATRAFGANVTAGNLIVVSASKYVTGGTFVAGDCTKSAGTATIGAITLDETLSQTIDGSNDSAGVWSCLVTGTGSCTMQISAAAGTYWNIATAEFASNAGWDASRVEDTAEAGTDTDTTGTATTSVLTTNGVSAGGALFYSVFGSDANGACTFTEDAAFTQIFEQANGSTALIGAHIRRIVSSGTTDQGEWLIAPAGGVDFRGYSSVLVVYKEGAAVAQVGPSIARLYYPEYKYFTI